MLEITKIASDSPQVRAAMNEATIDEYVAALEAGAEFPPIVVFYDAGTNSWWLADGWHRFLAHRRAGRTEILEDVRPGTRKDAVKYALGSNLSHGLRLTNADKRKKVAMALEEFPKLSSRAIAELCGVSHTFVEEARPQLATVASSARTGLDGKDRPAKGKKAKKAEKAKPTPKPAAATPPDDENYTDEEMVIDDLRERVDHLTAENQRLRDAVTIAAAPPELDAATVIPALRKRIQVLEAELEAIKVTRDLFMNENAEVKRECLSLRRKLDRAHAA